MGAISNNDSEDMGVLHAITFILPVALGAIGAWFAKTSETVATWMIAHKIMVPADQATLKIGDYAGLDTLRIIGAIALVVMLLFAVAMFGRRRERR